MKTYQHILSVIAFTLIDMFSCVPVPCSDGFLDYLSVRDIEMVIDTSDVKNQSVYELMNIPRIGRRKRGDDPPAYYASTPYLEIDEEQVIITSCPPVGETEVIEMIIEQAGSGCLYSVNFTVVLTEPEIVISDSYSIAVSSLVGEVDVQEFTLANEGMCTNFICSVSCINKQQEFWISNGTYIIRTSVVNITFDFVYELNLSCDDSDPVHGSNKTSTVYVEFSFIDSSPLTSGNHTSSTSSFSPSTIMMLSQTTTAVNSSTTSTYCNTSFSPACLLMTMTVILQYD